MADIKWKSTEEIEEEKLLENLVSESELEEAEFEIKLNMALINLGIIADDEEGEENDEEKI